MLGAVRPKSSSVGAIEDGVEDREGVGDEISENGLRKNEIKN